MWYTSRYELILYDGCTAAPVTLGLGSKHLGKPTVHGALGLAAVLAKASATQTLSLAYMLSLTLAMYSDATYSATNTCQYDDTKATGD
jgi:hypothetical protein